MFLCSSEAEIKLWHVTKKVEHVIARFRGSVPYAQVTVEQAYSNIPVPLPNGCPLETGLVFIPCSKKHFSQPSQKPSCIKHPTDTLTNKPQFKTTATKAGAVADVDTAEVQHLTELLLELVRRQKDMLWLLISWEMLWFCVTTLKTELSAAVM